MTEQATVVLTDGPGIDAAAIRRALKSHDVVVLGAGSAVHLPVELTDIVRSPPARAEQLQPAPLTDEDHRRMAAAEEKRQRRAAKRAASSRRL